MVIILEFVQLDYDIVNANILCIFEWNLCSSDVPLLPRRNSFELFILSNFNEKVLILVKIAQRMRKRNCTIMHIIRFENYDKLCYSIIQYYLCNNIFNGLRFIATLTSHNCSRSECILLLLIVIIYISHTYIEHCIEQYVNWKMIWSDFIYCLDRYAFVCWQFVMVILYFALVKI